MKNIQLIKTDKPSRLRIHECGQLFLSVNFIYEINDENKKHIYITSDLEIKEGNWMIRDNEQPTLVAPNFFWDFGVRYYKIILTTDQDLIKDGVQAIDDEFLEWFVKNPSCENVETDLVPVNKFGSEITVNSYGFDKFKYKIIIPKEEPKDVVLGYKTSLNAQMLNSQYVDFSNPNADKITSTSTTSMKQETLEEDEIIDISDHDGIGNAVDNLNNELPQETLEEAAENYIKSGLRYHFTFGSWIIGVKKGFIEGAKWQQERMYSEQDLKKAYFSAIESTGEGWNGEYANGNNPNIEENFEEGFEEWFEQFKKK